MLILKRRTGENLRIGTGVSITVLGVKGNQVKIGIHGPGERSMSISKANEN
ncbi:carbon storage regulator [Microbulbifer sp. JTAC008]|uniref:carbon storage regulator n=1 Tax=unclassified Microbulbifer TaxID=2619833 RepID=UPI00403A434D